MYWDIAGDDEEEEEVIPVDKIQEMLKRRGLWTDPYAPTESPKCDECGCTDCHEIWCPNHRSYGFEGG